MYMKTALFSLGMTALLGAAPSVTQAAVPNFNIPGVLLPGYPQFVNNATVTLAKTGGTFAAGTTRTYSLTATTAAGPFDFTPTPTSSTFTVNGTFNLTATFNVTGTATPVLTGGSVSINGTLPGYSGPQPSQTLTGSAENLFSANLTPGSFGFDVISDGSPVALGFVTNSFTGWATQFSAGFPESVYLFSFSVPSLMTQFNNPKLTAPISFTGAALTTVPVPAAVWLFSSAMLGFVGLRRRKSAA